MPKVFTGGNRREPWLAYSPGGRGRLQEGWGQSLYEDQLKAGTYWETLAAGLVTEQLRPSEIFGQDAESVTLSSAVGLHQSVLASFCLSLPYKF